MSLPNDPKKRLELKNALDKGLEMCLLISTIQSSIEDLASTLQDEDVCKAKLFKDLLKAKYEGEQLLLKAKQKVDDVESAIAEVEILSKVK